MTSKAIRTSTMTINDPFQRRAVIAVDVGSPAEERLIVTACAGTGPYTVTVRRANRLDRQRRWLRAFWRRPIRPITRRVKAWRLSRCDEPRCWRRANPDDEFNFYCQRHGGIARSADEVI